MKKLFTTLLFIIVLSFSADAVAKQKSILIIQSYHPDLAWTVQCEKGITSATGSKYRIETFYLDAKRLPETEFLRRAEAAWVEYKKTGPALVMIGDDIGLRLLGPKFAETQTPIIYFGINNNPRQYFVKLPDNITGVLERVPLFPWLRYLQPIIPWAEKALVLLDSSSTSEAILNVTFQKRTSVVVSGLNTEYKIARDWNEWKNIVKNAKGYDMIIMPTSHALKKEKGDHVSFEEVVEWTSKNSSVPVFSNQDYAVSSKGAVGSFVIYGEAHGRLAGEMAMAILEGEKRPQDISPKMDSKGKFYFNQTQLDRFHLTLPEKIKTQATFQ